MTMTSKPIETTWQVYVDGDAFSFPVRGNAITFAREFRVPEIQRVETFEVPLPHRPLTADELARQERQYEIQALEQYLATDNARATRPDRLRREAEKLLAQAKEADAEAIRERARMVELRIKLDKLKREEEEAA